MAQAGKPPRPSAVMPCVFPIWRWFWALDATRANNGFCSLPITYQEIRAFQLSTGTKLSNIAISAIKDMDAKLISLEVENANRDRR